MICGSEEMIRMKGKEVIRGRKLGEFMVLNYRETSKLFSPTFEPFLRNKIFFIIFQLQNGF